MLEGRRGRGGHRPARRLIGERLYEAKVYLNTPDLFAWTVVIVLVSLVFEKLFLFLLDRLVARLERG